MKLVICEKPSVGAAVAAALGVTGKKDGYIENDKYIISWCIGHLVQLSEAAAYGEQYRKWSYDSLPILPQEWQYTVAADKGKQFKILKDLMHRADVSEVVNACDAGREGELIFRFVYEMAGCKKPFTRLWISSMETDAIRSGFEHLKDGRGYDTLYHSALCRAKADWLIPNMDIYLNADRKACIRIIQNLIFNAVTSTTNNVVIQLINIADSVQLCIKNPVASIPTEEYSKLLERFYVADVSRSNGTSGQGLYIVKKLLLMMNCTNPIIEIHDHNFMITIDFSPLLIKK